MLSLALKVIREMGRLNPNKYCHYHRAIGHNTSECRDLLRQLWKLHKDGRLDEFVKRPQGKEDQHQEEAPR